MDVLIAAAEYHKAAVAYWREQGDESKVEHHEREYGRTMLELDALVPA